ncbi:hypothetical protein SB861_55840, partial [Paraburkholderia sp. SIMBA_049]
MMFPADEVLQAVPLQRVDQIDVGCGLRGVLDADDTRQRRNGEQRLDRRPVAEQAGLVLNVDSLVGRIVHLLVVSKYRVLS